MIQDIRKVIALFDRRTRIQFVLLYLLMIVGAILETCGVGLILPFISVIADTSIITSNDWAHRISRLLQIESTRDFILFMSIGMIGFYVFKSLFVGALTYLQMRYVFSERAVLCRKIYQMYLDIPYAYHLERNTAEFDRNLRFAVPKIVAYIESLLGLCTEGFVLLGIIVLLLSVNPLIVFYGLCVMGAFSIILYLTLGRYNQVYGAIIQSSLKHEGKVIYEGLAAIKEVKLSGKDRYFADRHFDFMMRNSRASWKHATLVRAPRLILEVLAVGVFIITILVLHTQGLELKSYLPTLSLFAVAIIRLMPSLSKIITCLQQMRFHSPAVDIVYRDICLFGPQVKLTARNSAALPEALPFTGVLTLKQVEYRYPDTSEMALKNVSGNIAKGETVGFVGPSGAGKTTLVNVILGLLEPTGGQVLVDEQDIFRQLDAWKRNVSYVPQSIYLLDADIRHNIAFALEEDAIDDARVWKALKAARIDDFVRSNQKGLEAFIGENGVRLSGGQRQRLGIARALYHEPELLVFDEATSALDTKTEKEVSTAIEKLAGRKTLIIIAHRLSTIQKCDRIFYMENGAVVDSGTFGELLDKNTAFRKLAETGNLTAGN